MRADELDQDDFEVVDHFGDEAEIVPADIEAYPAISKLVGTPQLGADIMECAPMGLAHDLRPFSQLLLGVRVRRPEIAQGAKAHEVHALMLSASILEAMEVLSDGRPGRHPLAIASDARGHAN